MRVQEKSFQINDGVNKQLLGDFKDLKDANGGTINADAVRTVLAKGMAMIKNDYKDKESSKGLAADRNALATTMKAAMRNWEVEDAAVAVAKGFLGENLDGLGGSMKVVESRIRHTAVKKFSGYEEPKE